MYTRDEVRERLFHMGKTLRRLSSKGCWPAGYMSSMPEYVQDSFAGMLDPDGEYHRTEITLARASPQEITEMDEAMEWFKLIPEWMTVDGRHNAIALRNLVWYRVCPTGKTKGKAKLLAQALGISTREVYRQFDYACDLIVEKLNRAEYVPPPCDVEAM